MTKEIKTHYGHFDNSGIKKWAITVNGELVTYDNGWNNNPRIKTFKTKKTALKAGMKF